MGATPKGNVKLSDGRELELDVSTMTVREWRGLWSGSDEENDKLIARLTGIEPDKLPDMLRDDYRRIVNKVIELSNRPLDNPN